MKWTTYSVVLEGITELLGGMPKDPKLITAMMSGKAIRLKAKALGRDPEKIIAQNLVSMGWDPEAVVAPVEPETGEPKEATAIQQQLSEEKLACTFRRTPDGVLAVGAHQIPSLLTDCATTLKLSRTVPGLKDTLTRGLECWQRPGDTLLELFDAEGPCLAPHGKPLEWGSQIQDRMGRRAILRRYDWMLPWVLTFTVRFVANETITKARWDDLWELGAIQGLGAARPRGYGKFRIEKMDRTEA